MGIFGIAVLTVYPADLVDADEAVLLDIGQRTRAAWDNRLEFYDAEVLLGPRAHRYERIAMSDPQYAGREWGALRMSACVRTEIDWGEKDRTFVEVIEEAP